MPLQLPNPPNFNVNTPQMPDALQQYGKMLQLRSLLGQQQMQPLQIEEAKQDVQAKTLQNQKEQLALDSQKKLQDAIASGAFNKYAGVETPDGTGFDAGKAYQDLVTNHGVLPDQASAAVNSLLTIAKNQAEIRKTAGQAGEAEQNIRAKTLEQVAAKLGSIGDMKADDAVKALAALKKDLTTNPQAYKGMSQQELAEIYGADLEHLPAMESLLGLEGKIADFHKSKAEAAKAQQGVIPEGGGLSPETQQSVQKEIAVNTNPQIQAGKEKVAREEGIARANIEAQIARGSNAALQNVPPHMVGPATADATKAGLEYAQAKSVSDRLALMMEAAKKGNVVSYQVIPEEGTLQITTSQGVHRINRTEIEQYAGGGSLWQRLEGHVGKALTGKSIPDSVLDDMSEIQKIQAEGSKTKYANSLATINQAYGSQFKPVEMKTQQAGSGISLTKEQLQAAAKGEGVTYEEALKQAKAQGYGVPQ